MTEGWPLIPREVFPAPVPAARRRLAPRPSPADMGRQLAFFAAETSEPAPGDLVGLLAGPGRLGRMGGTARVSVEVDAAWRVHVLVAELTARGLVTSWRPVEDDGTEVRPRFEVLTAYSQRLNGLARGWPQAAAQLFLSGPRLRLWVAASGAPDPGGYSLGLEPGKDLTIVDAALVRAGLAGKFSDGGRHYLIMGKRRLRLLAELVGERPPAAPAELWPGGAGA
jgi:hypothetical protein